MQKLFLMIAYLVKWSSIPLLFFAAAYWFGNNFTFTDNSTDTTALINRWSWDFGDGIGNSTSQNPVYTFGSGGTFNITLRAIDAHGCYADATKPFSIKMVPSIE